MDTCTIDAVGKVLGVRPWALVPDALAYLQDNETISRPELDGALQVIIDRLCLSLAVSKPIGLATWAERESTRFGSSGVTDIATAAAHSIALAARRYPVDYARLLVALELLRGEIERALPPPEASAEPSMTAEAVGALLAMLGERDHLTCAHSKATGEWARRLCAEMGISDEESTFIELCAILHDIGKVATPDRILLKPGELDESEWDIMRDHAAAGQRVLEQIPSLAKCAPIVRAHHERFDGKGYPDGIAGLDIPFEARLVAVADAFHAMISDRPYRRAIAPRAAMQILRDGRGTQWDPDVVDAMLALFDRKRAARTAPAQLPAAARATA